MPVWRRVVRSRAADIPLFIGSVEAWLDTLDWSRSDLNAKASMPRFKEGRRITAAIEAKDRKGLEWAEGYCRSRLSLASRKDHIKHWQALLRRIDEARERTSSSGPAQEQRTDPAEV